MAFYQQNSDGAGGIPVGEPFMNLVVLAGGRSERMGCCKYSTRLAGVPLYAYALRRLAGVCRREYVVENAGLVERDHVPGCLVVHDLIQHGGPLAGIHAGLTASDSWLNFVIAADMPFACPSLVAAMGEYAVERTLDIVYPNIDGLLEPLFAVYSQRVAAAALELLRAGRHSIRELFHDSQLSVGSIDRQFVVKHDERLLSFFNVNTPDDLIMARLMMYESEKSLQEERI
ncbi:MAG: molybdenum cofactor guanylyltransferase [Candidatus Cryosericum sp.]